MEGYSIFILQIFLFQLHQTVLFELPKHLGIISKVLQNLELTKN
jgi:hypothetical protein